MKNLIAIILILISLNSYSQIDKKVQYKQKQIENNINNFRVKHNTGSYIIIAGITTTALTAVLVDKDARLYRTGLITGSLMTVIGYSTQLSSFKYLRKNYKRKVIPKSKRY